MIIAIPLEDGNLCPHFGHCPKFALFQTDPKSKTIIGTHEIDAPPHEPGLLPNWLAERGVNLVICGGMGARALDLFKQKEIDVVTGAPVKPPSFLVETYLMGSLITSSNCCDH